MGANPQDQAALDAKMIKLDGTDGKSNLGANAILSVSLAAAHAAAIDQGLPLYRHLAPSGDLTLPVPMMNIINGGAHADNSVDIQEFMILPMGAPSFSEAVRYGAEVFHTLKKVLHAKGLNTAVGDEGGFAPDLPSNEAAITTILEAIDKAGYRAGKDIYLGLDVASTEFFKDGVYELESEGRKFNASEFADYLAGLVAKYPIVTVEDGMSEGDWDGWAILTRKLGSKVQLVGDDIVRDQHQDFCRRDRQEDRQCHSHQAKSNRHPDRNLGRHRHGIQGEVRGGRIASLRGNRGCHHRGYRGGDHRHADKDRFHVALGSRRQIQSAAAHRS